jgi:hypothetical protein
MTHTPTPSLAYRDRARDHSRAPLFVALAILAIIFGLLAAAINVENAITTWSFVGRPGRGAGGFLRLAGSSLFMRAPANLIFAMAGLAFLLRSHWAVRFLTADVILRVIGAGIFAIQMAIPSQITAPLWKGSLREAVPTIQQLIFLSTMLLILRAAPVRALFNTAAGAEQPLDAATTTAMTSSIEGANHD